MCVNFWPITWSNLAQFGPIWSNLAKSLVFKILTSYSHKMNIFENFEIFSNQILQDLLRVFIFGTILGPIWPNLALFVQVFSFQESYFTQRNFNLKNISIHYQETYKDHFGIKILEIYCRI